VSARRVRIIGVGPGDPDQVTLEAVAAMRSVDFFVVSDKSKRPVVGGMPDPLVNARERLLDRHLDAPAVVVRVQDPERERRPERTGTDEEYAAAVAAWHAARADAYTDAIRAHDGDVGFLVWGDPAFYDSTIRILDTVAERLELDVDVIPGISSIQLLAARHRIVPSTSPPVGRCARPSRPGRTTSSSCSTGSSTRPVSRTGGSGGEATSAPRTRNSSPAGSPRSCPRSRRPAYGSRSGPAG
jgi:precorrin-6A synthase (deacetylating)